MKLDIRKICILLMLLAGIHRVAAQGSAFTYQGRLNDNNAPANGNYDFRFILFNQVEYGNPVGLILTNSNTTVNSGLFTVTLDFGNGVFTGVNYWVEIGVRTNGGTTFTTLIPRQPITPTPYAAMANTASNLLGTVSATQLSGKLGNAQLNNSSITVNAGSGLSGGGAVALGGSTTLNNAGVLSVTGNSDITASTSGGVVTLSANASSGNSANTIVKRDSSGSFSAGTLTATNLVLPATNVTVYSGNNAVLRINGNLGNTFVGLDSGRLATNILNTAIGFQALYSNTSGGQNTAYGSQALYSNTSGNYNVANGSSALAYNTIGVGNTANGFQALLSNTTGSHNVANGADALFSNTTGNQNTANGYDTLYANISGSQNAAHGFEALYSNTTGSYNTADGHSALFSNISGSKNIALGYQAGFNLTTGSNNICIGNSGGVGANATIRIGTQGTQTNTVIAGIYGVTAASGVAVYVNSSGQLGTATSSARFKEGIRDMGETSDALLSLRPVTFRYRPEIDPKGIPQFGLIAEEVDKANPDLVVRDENGQIYTVRYEAINAMLLNEFLKQHHKVEEQKAEIQTLKEETALLKAQFADLEQVVKSLAGK